MMIRNTGRLALDVCICIRVRCEAGPPAFLDTFSAAGIELMEANADKFASTCTLAELGVKGDDSARPYDPDAAPCFIQ